MIQWLVKLGKWLESRFPEKREVSLAEYEALILRIASLESSAVHKGAVQDIIKIVATMRNELSSLKTSLGFSAGIEAAKIEAYLSGEPVNREGDNG